MTASDDGSAEPAVRSDQARSNPRQSTPEMVRLELTSNLADSPFPSGEPRSHDVGKRVRQLRRLSAAHRDATGHAGKCRSHVKEDHGPQIDEEIL